MARRLLALAALWVAVGLGVVAADFWEEKPFRSWSDGETNKILTDSPWADEIAVALPPQLSSSAGGGTGGVSSPAAGGGGGGAAPQRARGRESFSNVSRVRMSVSWRSALPVKQALLREQVGEGGELSPENEAYLEHDAGFYIIAVLGVPTQFARIPTDQVRASSFLERKDKPPIPADDVLFQPGQDGLLLLVAFPKTDPLTLEDQDIEFMTNLGNFSINKRFRLRDMMFQGGLAL